VYAIKAWKNQGDEHKTRHGKNEYSVLIENEDTFEAALDILFARRLISLSVVIG